MFRVVESEKLSGAIVRQVEGLILRGVLRPGDRLPPERELAERLGVSRPSLREALAELQAGGLLAARAGAGVFVADVLGSAFSPALVRLISAHEDAVLDYVAFRRDMEGIAALRAAEAGTDADLAVIAALMRKIEAAHRRRAPDEEARLDALFHMAIVEASHNVIALHMMRSMTELLCQGVVYNRQLMFRQRSVRDALLEQHRAIDAALQRRDGAEARAAAERHLDYVRDALLDQRTAARHEEEARLRLAHEAAR